MRRYLRLGISLLLFAACSVLTSALAERQLTLMIYMCGSNLESEYGSASDDIHEIANSGVDTSRVDVLVMTGGSRRWMNGQDADAIRISAMRGNQLVNRWEEPNRSMGDPETLRMFVDWSIESFPAAEYALILWDHGAGPLEGVCLDELNTPDRLSVTELAGALEASKLPGRLKWIGFDACLMSTVEVASKLAPYAEYMIASQEREPVNGWDYAFLEDLADDADGAATGRRVVDRYMACPYETRVDLTMACVDLSAVSEIESSLDAMYGGMAEAMNEATFSKVARLRVSATGFGKNMDSANLADGYDLADVVSLSDCYAAEDPEGARRVREAVARAVVAHGENLEHCCGISVYHPFRNKKGYDAGWKRDYSALNFCPGYSEYVRAYGNIMSGHPLMLWNDLTNIRASGEGSLVTLKISDEQAENLASARLVVLARNLFDEADSAYFRVFSTAEVSVHDGLLAATYDGSSMQITDEAGVTTLTGAVSYGVAEDGHILLKLYPIEQDGARWETPIIAEYELDGAGVPVLKSYSVYDALTGVYSSRARVDLSAFKGLVFLNDYRIPTTNDVGEWLAFDQWDEDTHTDMQVKAQNVIYRTAFAPSFALDSFRSEDLYAAYEITDTQGNVYMSAMTPLTEGGARFYSSEMTLGEAYPGVEASLTASWQDRFIALSLYICNLSEEEQYYAVFDLKADGREAPYYGGAISGGTGDAYRGGETRCLRPGELGSIHIFLDADSFEGMSGSDVLNTLSGTLYIASGESEDGSYWVQFTAEAAQPLDVLFHAPDADGPDDATEAIPFHMLGTGAQKYRFSARVIAQRAERAEDSRIIVNTVVRNDDDRDIMFYIRDVRVNGVPVDALALSAMGTGSASSAGRLSVAKGEAVAASIVLDYDTVSAILPDVSLRDVSFRLAIGTLEDGEKDWRNVVPVDLTTEVPLDLFYPDASTLPSIDLLAAGAELGAFDADTARALFTGGDCEVSLQGVFISERSFILLLRFENHGEQEQQVALGRARLDGREAVIGGTVSAQVRARNNRARSLGLAGPLWQEETGVYEVLAPGETLQRYITIEPAFDDQTEASELTFQAYMFASAYPAEGVWFDDTVIRSEEAGPLTEGFEAIAPSADYTVKPGTPVSAGAIIPLFDETVQVSEPDLCECAMTIEYPMPDGERMQKGYYVLFRRIRSDAELAGLNIINSAEGNHGEAAVSFADGREWLLYEASGMLSAPGDGSLASAEHPGLRGVILAGGESLPLIDAVVSADDAGRFILDKYGADAIFSSASFPNVPLPSGFNSVTLAWDPASGQAALEDCHRIGSEAMDALRELVVEDVFLLPGDADEAEIVALLQGDGGVKRYMLLHLDGPQMRLGLERLGDPDDYSVVFYYKTQDGDIHCTAPAPLSDYVR